MALRLLLALWFTLLVPDAAWSTYAPIDAAFAQVSASDADLIGIVEVDDTDPIDIARSCHTNSHQSSVHACGLPAIYLRRYPGHWAQAPPS